MKMRMIASLSAMFVLIGCGGDDGRAPAQPAVNSPTLTLAPGEALCAWMRQTISPATEPTGLGNPSGRIHIYQAKNPVRNAGGLVQYAIDLNPFVVQHYDAQAKTHRLGVSGAALIAQEAACGFGITVLNRTATLTELSSFMTEQQALGVVMAPYSSGGRQVETPDDCTINFGTAPPRPECGEM